MKDKRGESRRCSRNKGVNKWRRRLVVFETSLVAVPVHIHQIHRLFRPVEPNSTKTLAYEHPVYIGGCVGYGKGEKADPGQGFQKWPMNGGQTIPLLTTAPSKASALLLCRRRCLNCMCRRRTPTHQLVSVSLGGCSNVLPTTDIESTRPRCVLDSSSSTREIRSGKDRRSVTTKTTGKTKMKTGKPYRESQLHGRFLHIAHMRITFKDFPSTSVATLSALRNSEETKGFTVWSYTTRFTLGQTGFDSRWSRYGIFANGKIVQDNAAGRWVFSRISRFPHPCIPALLRSHLASISSALKTLILSLPHLSPPLSTPFNVLVRRLCLSRRDSWDSEPSRSGQRDCCKPRRASGPIVCEFGELRDIKGNEVVRSDEPAERREGSLRTTSISTAKVKLTNATIALDARWRVLNCCKLSWCSLTAVHSQCMQQEPVNTMQPRETECSTNVLCRLLPSDSGESVN
ncbi:hypothetical protein PR048_017692 [Dryococelus australis]|uniref:Uncharacterized protein n=1 Tax=Dryococelus australis TaxID=614101 RepID=A0ABQ9HA77_9NEOP|nr:hypothetical protein PR048_017692 [Dryococelus australis]